MRAFVRRLLAALAVVSVIVAVSFFSAFRYAEAKVGQIHRVACASCDASAKKPGQPANYLIVGSDTRAFVDSAKQAQHFGTSADTGPQRSDTIMVVHVDPGAKSGMVLSFPRDLWVDVVGRGPSKINAAYNQGVNNLVATIQKNFDIPIQHYLEVDFASFQKIVDAIGGVRLYFPTPAKDTYTGLDIRLPGCVSLDGEQALEYARSRHYQHYIAATAGTSGHWSIEDPRADIGRIARQQYFMRTIAQTALSKARHNPLTAKRILDRTIPYLRADQALDLGDLQRLASTFRTLDPARVPMETMPFTAGSADGQSVLFVDQAKAKPLLDRMRSFTNPDHQKPTAPVEPKDVKASDVSVAVYNGSGVQGAAHDAFTALKTGGFDMLGSPADASRSDYTTTQIRYQPGHRSAGQLVLFRLGGRGQLVEASDVTGENVELILGKDYAGVGSSGSAATSTTTVTTEPLYLGDPTPGMASAQNPDANLPLVGCPPKS
jgi:polyisoprenyl-teichoic acid--peptidoglycan teichoic acid transferase